MRARITKRLVDRLKPTGTDYYAFDTDTIGFTVRVRTTGGMSYIVQYKAGSGRGAPARRVTLGGVGKMTPEQARAAARKVLGSVAQGKDPAADKANERRSLPLGDVIEAFLVEHAESKRKGSTAAWYRSGLQRIVKPALGGMNPGKVTRQDVARLHSSLRETSVQANRVVAMIGALYSFAAKAGYVPEEYNPARGIEKFPERSRERFLTSEELARLGGYASTRRDDRAAVASRRKSEARSEGGQPPRHSRPLRGRSDPPLDPDRRKVARNFACPLGVHRLRTRSHLLARQQDRQEADLFERGGARRPLDAPASRRQPPYHSRR